MAENLSNQINPFLYVGERGRTTVFIECTKCPEKLILSEGPDITNRQAYGRARMAGWTVLPTRCPAHRVGGSNAT